MPIHHIKTVTIADASNTDIVRPSDWNSAHSVTLASNELIKYVSAGTLSMSSGQHLVFSNSNGMSFGLSTSTNGGTVTGSYTVPTQTVQPGIQSVSAGTTRVTTGEVILSNSNGISFGANGQTITASYTVPTVTAGSDTIGMSNLGNTSGTTGVVSGDSVRYLIAGGNNITLSQSLNGVSGTVTISAANQTVQAQSFTLTGNTAGNSTVTGNQIYISGGANVTVSGTNNSIVISAAAGGGGGNFSAGVSGGNTAGDTGITGTRVVFAGGNNITLSQATDANGATITFSGAAAGGAGFSAGVSGGNTSGDTGATGTRVVFAGGNNVTLSQLTDANGATITVSGVNTVAQTVQTQSLIAGVYDGVNSISTGTIRLVNANGFSFSINGQSLSGSHNGLTSQSNQNVTAGNGGFAFQTLSFSNVNGVSFGTSAGSAITASVAAQTNQSVGLYGVGNTTQNSSTTLDARTLSFGGRGDITVGFSNGTVQISGTQTVQTQSLIAALYDGANSISTGTVRLTNANGVSFSINGQTLSASVAAQTNQTLGLYAVSNTTGQSSSSTFDARTLSFHGAGIASVGYSGGSVVISVPAGGGGGDGGVFGGMSNLGNTAGSSGTVSTGNLVLVGSGPITLSQSTAAAGSHATVSIIGPATSSLSATGLVSISTNGSTISIGVPGYTKSGLHPWADIPGVIGAVGQGTLQFDPMFIPNVQFDRFAFGLNNTNSSNSSGSHTLSFWVGLYTRNASTLSLLQSTSSTTALTHSGTAGSYSLYSGLRLFTIPFTTTLTEGEYWMGFLSRTTSGGANGSYSNLVCSYVNSNFLGHFGSSHNTTYQLTLGRGVYSATTSAMPSSIGFTQIRGSDSMAQRAVKVMMASSTI